MSEYAAIEKSGFSDSCGSSTDGRDSPFYGEFSLKMPTNTSVFLCPKVSPGYFLFQFVIHPLTIVSRVSCARANRNGQ